MNDDLSPTQETVLTAADLPALDAQFKDLRRQINENAYIVEASQEGKVESESEYSSTRSHYSNRTQLTVSIKPAATNTAASIKEMSFIFKHSFGGTSGSWSTTQDGSVQTSFRIAAASGNVYSYGPEYRDINDNSCTFLTDVREAGLYQVYQDEVEKSNAIYRAEKQREEEKKQHRDGQIKNDLKL